MENEIIENVKWTKTNKKNKWFALISTDPDKADLSLLRKKCDEMGKSDRSLVWRIDTDWLVFESPTFKKAKEICEEFDKKFKDQILTCEIETRYRM